jgi:hypothetical protein
MNELYQDNERLAGRGQPTNSDIHDTLIDYAKLLRKCGRLFEAIRTYRTAKQLVGEYGGLREARDAVQRWPVHPVLSATYEEER